RHVATDFLLVRTTPRAATECLRLYEFAPLQSWLSLDFLDPARGLLIVGGAGAAGTEGRLVIYDARLRLRLEITVDWANGYASRRGVEWSAGGLRVLRAWDVNDVDRVQEVALPRDGVVIHVRVST